MEILKLYMLFMVISLITSLFIYFRRPNPHFYYLQFFPPILVITLAVELLGSYNGSIGKNNMLLYNLFSIFWVCYYLFIISLIIHKPQVKKIIWITIVLYFLATMINIVFIQKLHTSSFNTVTHSLGFSIIVVFCIYYFLELFRFPKAINLKNNPAFWICTGLLFFCACGFPLYGFINVWATVPFIVKNFGAIITILNIFLYSLFTIAFLCVITPKYTLSSS